MDIVEKIGVLLGELSAELSNTRMAIGARMIQSPVERYKARQAERLKKKKKDDTDDQTSQSVSP
jgi:hypothetical protein